MHISVLHKGSNRGKTAVFLERWFSFISCLSITEIGEAGRGTPGSTVTASFPSSGQGRKRDETDRSSYQRCASENKVPSCLGL